MYQYPNKSLSTYRLFGMVAYDFILKPSELSSKHSTKNKQLH